MAPRPLESVDQLVARLHQAAADGTIEVRFGGHHFTHAARLEDGVWRVRRLELSNEDAEAYLAEHGIFMPEHAEEISKPGSLVFEAEAIDDLEAWLRDQSWPLC